MTLIKCPECGKDVSTAAESCPHCGFPIKKESSTKIVKEETFPAPIDSNWVNKWRKRLNKVKLIFSFT